MTWNRRAISASISKLVGKPTAEEIEQATEQAEVAIAQATETAQVSEWVRRAEAGQLPVKVLATPATDRQRAQARIERLS